MQAVRRISAQEKSHHDERPAKQTLCLKIPLSSRSPGALNRSETSSIARHATIFRMLVLNPMRNDGIGRAEAMQRGLSSVRQFEPFLHPLQSVGQPINALGKPPRLLREPAQVQHERVRPRARPSQHGALVRGRRHAFHRLRHGCGEDVQEQRCQAQPSFEVTRKSIALNSDPLVAATHRVSFLYFTRCGMIESWPSLRILSFS
jgi:hypothetical protein